MSSRKSRTSSHANAPIEQERSLSVASTVPEILVDPNIAMHCVLKNTVERFIKCFEDDEDPYKEKVEELIVERNEDGKSPIDMACILGRPAMVKELIARGVDPNVTTVKGKYESVNTQSVQPTNYILLVFCSKNQKQQGIYGCMIPVCLSIAIVKLLFQVTQPCILPQLGEKSTA